MPKVLIVDDDRAARHLLRATLVADGFTVAVAGNGAQALQQLRSRRFDVMLLDLWMPKMTGLDLLAKLRTRKVRPRVIVMTSDDTPATLLKAVREEAVEYIRKPLSPPAVVRLVREVLERPAPRPIEVVSARPEWVELVVPCSREAVERVHGVVAHLDADLPADAREAIAFAFRELLMNAVEWGGKLDPTRTVRISYLRAQRMVLYRIADPGSGFKLEDLDHAAITHPDDPVEHVLIRDRKGLRPGGFGLMTVQATVDELIYNEKRNEVVFIKYLDPVEPTKLTSRMS